MNFSDTYIRLITDKTIFQEIINKKFTQSFKFFSLFYLLFSLMVGVYVSIRYIPDSIATIQEIGSSIKENIPDTSVFTIENGQLTTAGIETPITISSPQSFKEIAPKLFYLDPMVTTTDLASSGALISIGNTDIRLVSPETSNSQLINYTKDSISGSITGQEIHQNNDQVIQSLQSLRPFAALIIGLTLGFGLIIARLTYTATYSLLFALGSLLVGRKTSFVRTLGLTLHTIVIADTLNASIYLIYGQSYPTIFSIAFFGMTLYAYFNLPVEPKKR